MNKLDEMVEGYRAGSSGFALPVRASAAYAHGWRNGRLDFGYGGKEERAEVLRRRAEMIVGQGNLTPA